MTDMNYQYELEWRTTEGFEHRQNFLTWDEAFNEAIDMKVAEDIKWVCVTLIFLKENIQFKGGYERNKRHQLIKFWS